MCYPMLDTMCGLEITEETSTVEPIQTFLQRIRLTSLTTVSSSLESTMLQLRSTWLEKKLGMIRFLTLVTPKVHLRCSQLLLTTTEI
jgi:hypothetical protein